MVLPSQMALLGHGLHQGFTTSYLDPKVTTKTLLSIDGCQITIIEMEKNGGPLLPPPPNVTPQYSFYYMTIYL